MGVFKPGKIIWISVILATATALPVVLAIASDITSNGTQPPLYYSVHPGSAPAATAAPTTVTTFVPSRPGAVR